MESQNGWRRRGHRRGDGIDGLHGGRAEVCLVSCGDHALAALDPGDSQLDWVEGGGVGREEALREVREETSLQVCAERRLTRVCQEPEVNMRHFVFACRRLVDTEIPLPDRNEIAAWGYWPLDVIPRPISDFALRRIHDAPSADLVTAMIRVPPWEWFD